MSQVQGLKPLQVSQKPELSSRSPLWRRRFYSGLSPTECSSGLHAAKRRTFRDGGGANASREDIPKATRNHQPKSGQSEEQN